jgi:hypothetical protein
MDLPPNAKRQICEQEFGQNVDLQLLRLTQFKIVNALMAVRRERGGTVGSLVVTPVPVSGITIAENAKFLANLNQPASLYQLY